MTLHASRSCHLICWVVWRCNRWNEIHSPILPPCHSFNFNIVLVWNDYYANDVCSHYSFVVIIKINACRFRWVGVSDVCVVGKLAFWLIPPNLFPIFICFPFQLFKKWKSTPSPTPRSPLESEWWRRTEWKICWCLTWAFNWWVCPKHGCLRSPKVSLWVKIRILWCWKCE
jgi:hypothetical protein